MDSDYELGKEPYTHPYKGFLPTQLHIILKIMKPINIIIVAARNMDNPLILSIFTFIAIVGIYNMNKRPDNLQKCDEEKSILDYLM